MLRFPLYRRQPGLSNSLPYNDVNCFAEDKGRNIWIGTNGGGLIYFDRSRNIFTRYRHEPGNYNSLTCDVIVALTVDHEGKLWIGTYQGGLDCFDGHKFIHYRHNDADPGSLSDDNVYAIREEAGGDLWIGTLLGGLDRLDKQKNSFYHNNTGKPYSIHSNYISSLAYDADLNLWIGTAYGIDILRGNTGKYEHFTKENSKLSDNTINALYADSRGNMWAATRRGLSVLQPGKDSFQVFHASDGLPSNTILNVLEDNDHFLWVSTLGGLSRIAVSEDGAHIGIKCVNYDEYDGLQGREFNTFAALKTSKGELVFGGANGFNLFMPSSIVRDGHIPPVVLTGFQLFNKEVPLPASVPGEGKLVLSYDENSFSLEFAGLSYINALKNKYAYQLVGLDKDWVTVDGRSRRATYTNIEPGSYVFRVRASNGDGVWNEQGISVRIVVKPPFWKTTWAYTIYFLFILAALYLARLQIINRARARFALAEERREALRIRELDRMKIKFITNLSHEFRTPLSLILAPVDKLIKGAEDAGRKQLGMLIERNAKRLLHLVNQLLDLRKMEVNELKLNIGQGDIAGFIKETTDSFADLAEQKGIVLNYQSTVDRLPALFDKDKIERILFNLLSNAFKFTSAGGRVVVELSIAEQEENGVLLELRVKDTGIGIPEALQGKIFESFFQGELPGHILNQGTGIGLAITREFVEMHGGTIKVESTAGSGSCFTVLLPVTLVAGKLAAPAIPDTNRAPAEQDILKEADEDDVLSVPELEGKPTRILLVEDDEDFRFYLKDNLAPLFTLVEATNGKEGWQKALSAHPDLVVTDVNMPVMDGLELCRKIKADPRTRHIPVVLLTALSDEQDQLRALGAGANDYISKPFNVEILISRIRNLLQYKGSMEQTFKRRIDIQPRDIEVEPGATAEDFIRQAVDVLEKHIENADFSIDDWSRELHLSRTTLYKNIVAGTGKTPIGFIRSFRLKRAAQLLEKSRHNVTEVAYMVGFNNPKYFARYFKEEFGKLPSVYQAEKRKKD
ncbi:MAG TPA: two-component regulator propeller domain-containing protein [Chitinophagaceae bacterium]|nr:two-component regulator propeller domain-containing protein [Chitinophagaceae bacterium]